MLALIIYEIYPRTFKSKKIKTPYKLGSCRDFCNKKSIGKREDKGGVEKLLFSNWNSLFTECDESTFQRHI